MSDRTEVDESFMRAAFAGAVQKAGGVCAFARLAQVSAPYVGDIMHGRRGISDRIAKVLGYERIERVTFRRTGFAPPTRSATCPTDAASPGGNCRGGGRDAPSAACGGREARDGDER